MQHTYTARLTGWKTLRAWVYIDSKVSDSEQKTQHDNACFKQLLSLCKLHGSSWEVPKMEDRKDANSPFHQQGCRWHSVSGAWLTSSDQPAGTASTVHCTLKKKYFNLDTGVLNSKNNYRGKLIVISARGTMVCTKGLFITLTHCTTHNKHTYILCTWESICLADSCTEARW